MRKKFNWAVWLAGAVLTVTLPGCGGGGGGGSTTGPSTPSTPQPIVVAQGSSNLGPALPGRTDFFGTRSFTTSVVGRLDVTVDWTFASNDIDIAVVRGNCSPAQVVADSCGAPIAESTSTTAKPERLSIPNLAAGTYTLVVVNFSPNPEGVSFQIVLQP